MPFPGSKVTFGYLVLATGNRNMFLRDSLFQLLLVSSHMDCFLVLISKSPCWRDSLRYHSRSMDSTQMVSHSRSLAIGFSSLKFSWCDFPNSAFPSFWSWSLIQQELPFLRSSLGADGSPVSASKIALCIDAYLSFTWPWVPSLYNPCPHHCWPST